jgi:hypothetical protein
MAVTTDAAAQDLAVLARNLREAGETGLRRDLTAAIKHAADTIPPVVRAQLPDRMPDRYAAVLDPDLDMGSSTRTTGTEIGVSVYARPRGRKKRKLPRLDAGILWHPVFGSYLVPRRQWEWAEQGAPSVLPGFFSGPVDDAAPRVRGDMIAAIDRVNSELWRGT